MTATAEASMPRRSVLRAVTSAGAIVAFPALLGRTPVLDKKASAGSDLAAAPVAVVMVSRHEEKPAKTDPAAGADLSGHPDIHSLTAQGWTRAAYLVGLFAGNTSRSPRSPPRSFAPASPAPPASGPDEVYDRVWVFTAASGGWRFEDVPQMPGGTP